jgi:hypothetical protein
MDEVKTVIEMEKFDSKKAALTEGEYRNIFINQLVYDQLREFVTCVASLYQYVQFSHGCAFLFVWQRSLTFIFSST